MDKDTREDLTLMMENTTKEQFEEYLEANDKDDHKHDCINQRVSLLMLNREDVDMMRRYKDFIMSRYKLTEHLNVIKLLKTYEYLVGRLTRIKETSLITNLLKYDDYKVLLVREFENYYNMKPLDVEGIEAIENFKPLDKHLFYNIKRAFETTKGEPDDKKSTRHIYLMMLRHLTSNEIITSSRSRKASDRGTYHHSANHHYINFHIELNGHANGHYRNYHDEVVRKYRLATKQDVKHDDGHADMFLDGLKNQMDQTPNY